MMDTHINIAKISPCVSKKRSFLALSLSHGVMHGYLVILPALLPLIKKEFNNYLILGLMMSVVFSIYGWGSFPAGVIADRWSKKKLVVLSMLLCGIASLFVALAHSLFFIIASLTILGIGTAFYHPAGFSYIATFTDRTLGRWMGVHGFAGNVGMAMGFVTSATVGHLAGWRNTFLVWAGIGVIIAIIDLIILEEQKNREKGNKDKISDVLLEYFHSLKESFSSTISASTLIAILILIICSGALWNGVSAFLVTYINDIKGLPLTFAGGLAAISYTVGSFAQILGGEISDRYGRIIIMSLGFALFAIFLFLFTLPFVTGRFSMILFVSMLGFFFFLTQPSLTALIADISPSSTVGFMYGANFGIKYGVGGVSPLFAGFLADIYSMNWIFYFFFLISIVAFVSCFQLRTQTTKSTQLACANHDNFTK